MYTLLDNPATNRLIESFQSNDVKFAFVNHTATENQLQLLMPWVKCREYFNELLMVNHHPEEFSFDTVHGFKYDHENFPLNKDKVFLAIKFPNAKTCDNFTNNLDFLHTVERFNNLDQLTTIHKTAVPTVLVLEASKFWQQRCILLNIYTLLIKLGSLNFPQTSLEEFNNSEHYYSSELSYLRQLQLNRFDSLLQNLTNICEIPIKYVDGSEAVREPYTIHQSSGIMALINKYSLNDTNIGKFTKAFNKFLNKKVPFFFKEATT